MTEGPDAGREAYRRSGVDVEAASRAVELIRDIAGRAPSDGVVEGVGGFAGLVRLDERRLLAAATDGVGTKLEVARRMGRLDTVGIDLVAMCANDVVCTGARPLFFLDYLAVGSVVPEEVAAIVGGVAEGCRRAGCALLGGETAEHPGLMKRGHFDLAGFCVGLVEQDALLRPGSVRAGDALVGLASSGLHANGFSLVRSALGDRSLEEFVPELGRSLGEELLEPTIMYVRALLEMAGDGIVRAAAHITGGGLYENLPRAIAPGLGAVLDTKSWTPAPVFGLVARAAGLERGDLHGVLNMGIGMVVVIARGHEDRAVGLARDAGVHAMVIGDVVEGTGVTLR